MELCTTLCNILHWWGHRPNVANNNWFGWYDMSSPLNAILKNGEILFFSVLFNSSRPIGLVNEKWKMPVMLWRLEQWGPRPVFSNPILRRPTLPRPLPLGIILNANSQTRQGTAGCSIEARAQSSALPVCFCSISQAYKVVNGPWSYCWDPPAESYCLQPPWRPLRPYAPPFALPYLPTLDWEHGPSISSPEARWLFRSRSRLSAPLLRVRASFLPWKS